MINPSIVAGILVREGQIRYDACFTFRTSALGRGLGVGGGDENLGGREGLATYFLAAFFFAAMLVGLLRVGGRGGGRRIRIFGRLWGARCSLCERLIFSHVSLLRCYRRNESEWFYITTVRQAQTDQPSEGPSFSTI